MSIDPAEVRVLDAAKLCCERWGLAKVTIDDIATEAGVSRATLYRLFPGGKDVLSRRCAYASSRNSSPS